MGERFLEQRINIRFFVKLDKNASDICAMFSEAYVVGAVRKSSFFEWRRWFKENSHVEMTDEDSAHRLLRYQVYCSL